MAKKEDRNDRSLVKTGGIVADENLRISDSQKTNCLLLAAGI